jgi:hypothetical protein
MDNSSSNVNYCKVLDDFINKMSKNVTYNECLWYLNSHTTLSQIQLQYCLLQRFPKTFEPIHADKWDGVL